MSTFEDRHPGLKDCKIWMDDAETPLYDGEDIDASQLDKAIVREAMDKYIRTRNTSVDAIHFRQWLIEELELE